MYFNFEATKVIRRFTDFMIQEAVVIVNYPFSDFYFTTNSYISNFKKT